MNENALVLFEREIAPVREAEPGASSSPVLAYLGRLSKGSRETMLGALVKIVRIFGGERCEHPDTEMLQRNGRSVRGRGICPLCDPLAFKWAQLRYQETHALRSILAERYAPASANKMLAALRGVLEESWKLGQLSAEQLKRAKAIAPIRGSTLGKGRSLARLELRGLLEACAADASPAGRRDEALIAVLYGAGIRRAEAVALDVSDVDFAGGFLTISRGKGNKDRKVPPVAGALDRVSAWLAQRGDEAGPLFCPVNKGGNLVRESETRNLRRLGRNAVRNALRKRAAESEIVRPFSAHDFRRTFAGDLLDAGADLSTVQKLLGHASPSTTAIYDRRSDEARKAATARIRI